MSDREHIPASLQRDLMIESGYRCAVCKTTSPLEIEHIEEYAKVQRHEFSNMIVLCANCHGRKEDKANPRAIDRIALKKIKSDLLLVNARYSDLEKRIIEIFHSAIQSGNRRAIIQLRNEDQISVMRLAEDKIASLEIQSGGISVGTKYGTVSNDILFVILTEDGAKFIENLNLFDHKA